MSPWTQGRTKFTFLIDCTIEKKKLADELIMTLVDIFHIYLADISLRLCWITNVNNM